MRPQKIIKEVGKILFLVAFCALLTINILAGLLFMFVMALGGKYVYYRVDKRDGGHALHIKLGNETSKGSRTKERGKVK